MNKKEFTNLLYQKEIFKTKTETMRAVDVILETIEEALISGEKISFINWGSFEIVKRKKRKGINPRTGKTLIIPAKKIVKFKTGKKLSEKINL